MSNESLTPLVAPPRLAMLLVRWLFARQGRGITEGDFIEVHTEIHQNRSRLAADAWCWGQLFLSVKSYTDAWIKWEFSMIRNYLKTAWRNIQRQKGHALINLGGLAVGICVALFLFLYIDYELGFDSVVPRHDRIFRVVRQVLLPTGREYDGSNYFPMSKALRNDFSDLQDVAQTYRTEGERIQLDGEEFRLDMVMFVEPAFYRLVPPTWIHEDPDKGTAPNTVVLTEGLALRLFGTSNAVGKTFTLDDSLTISVSGVVANPPRQTSLPYTALFSWGTMEHFYTNDGFHRWNMIDGGSQTFLRLPESINPIDFEAQLDVFKRKYLDPDDHESHSFHLQRLREMHLDSRYGAIPYTVSRSTLWAFGITGLLILVIACINFVNMTTARAMKRAREMGMRKVLGASRALLIRQLMGETGLLIIVAMALGVAALTALQSTVEAQLDITLMSDKLISSQGLVFFAGLFLFLIFLNGIYPALVLSRYSAADALKGSRFHKGRHSALLRNGLVLVQFAVTQILVVATLIIAAQVRFIGNKDLGFQKQGMLLVTCPSYEETRNEGLRSRWMSHPHVEEVSFAWGAPTSESNFRTNLSYTKQSDEEYAVTGKLCDSHYLDAYGISLAAGSFFGSNGGDDQNPQWVINEEAVRTMGLDDVQQAVGEPLRINGMNGHVLGVVKDFHVYSLKDRIEPVVLFNFWPRNHREAQIRVTTANLPETLTHIRSIWEATYPGETFSYQFLDQILAAQYQSDGRVLKLIQVATLLAVLIGCLGLLGLVSFVLAQRTKEIGVRKVLGASAQGLFLLISRDFLKWIIAASLIAWPSAFLFSQKWLQGFVYRIPMQVVPFLLGSGLVLVVALLVISGQVTGASRANPVKALKYE